jgi:hypothetical protein
MGNLSDRALISRLYTSAEERLSSMNVDFEDWQDWYEGVQALTGPEKMAYVIVKLNQNVTSGGFVQYFEESFGIFAPETAHALNTIKAVGTANIVSEALNIMNPSGLLDNDYKKFIFNLTIQENQRSILYALDSKYDSLEGQENLEDLLGAFLQELIKEE